MNDAADKLARSRLALIEHMQRRERRDEKKEARRAREREQGEQDEQGWDKSEASDAAGWFANLKRAASAWWRSHPARLGVELATPVLSGYATRKPAQFLAIAAGVGALVMVTRPWRLISVTGLVVTLLKSSQLTSVIMSAMSAADFKRDDETYP
jgi:hypothetical protein